MDCEHCNGTPPIRIDFYRNPKGNRKMEFPMRYKKCEDCGSFICDEVDTFYNNQISIVCAKFYRKIIDCENET